MINKKALKMQSKGYYSLSVLDINGKEKQEKSVPYVGNVITYAGAYVSLIGADGPTNTLYAAIGTGTTEIVRADTGLGVASSGRSGGAGANRSGNETDNGDGTSTLSFTRTMTFSLGSKVGTFSEIGVYTSATTGTFVAGQLIKDEFGDATTITLLSDEQLIVTYTLEWVIPIVSNLVGSGTVTDAASNSYGYEIWAQPYYGEYSVGSTTNTIRYYESNGTGDEVCFRQANGTTSTGASIDAGPTLSFSHNGTGTVTITANPGTYSPTSTTFTDVVFMGFNFYQGTNNGGDVINTTSPLGRSVSIGTPPAFYIKFLTPFSKTSSQSFTIDASMTISV
jgi:hypothetical protein